MKHVLASLGNEVLQLDSAILRTFSETLLDPGGVARKYVEGQRVPYVNPVKYTFFAATVAAFVLSVTHTQPLHVWAGNQVLGASERGFSWFLVIAPYAVFVLSWPLVWVQARLFKADFNLVETYVVDILVFGQFMYLTAIAALAHLLYSRAATIAFVIVEWLFWSVACAQFYKVPLASAALRTLVLQGAFLLISGSVLAGLVLLVR